MKIWIALSFAAFAVLASAKCPPCETMKWASCDGIPCQCFLAVSNSSNQTLDCTKLIPKCFLMKAEMHSQKNHTIGGKPAESADENYDPECESDGKFKAKQCNNAEECWCVNSAGVRRTDKGDKNLTCDELVETVHVRLSLTHKPVSTALDTTTLKADIADAINRRYKNFSKDLVANVTYDSDKRLIWVDVMTKNGSADLAGMAYYMEKDVKGQTLFTNKDEKFEPIVGGQKLEIENIKVNYIDSVPPDYTPSPGHLYPSIITIVVVVVVVIAFVALCCRRKRRR